MGVAWLFLGEENEKEASLNVTLQDKMMCP